MAENQRMPDPTLEALIVRNTGNSDQFTRKYNDSLLIEMRIVDSDLSSTEADFFGTKLATPIMLGNFGGYNLMGENALLNEAAAAKELDTVIWLNEHTSDEEIETVISSGAKVGFVIKPYRDLDRFITAAKKMEAAGAIAIASDIDHAYSKQTGTFDGRPGSEFGPRSSDELRRIVSSLNVPFIAKGVLSVHDALKCKEAGVAGILLSHHHNIMDFSVPPLMILPDVRKAVGPDYPIIVDCGIDTGADAFKAIALGANLVSTARAVMVALKKGGKDGVVELISKNTAELRNFMNRTGSPDLKHVDPTVIHRLTF